jgi:hypothetical protein
MRVVGRRKESQVSFSPSCSRLRAGAEFNDQIHLLPSGSSTSIPKGVYHFKTHAEANIHQRQCLLHNIVQVASERA